MIQKPGLLFLLLLWTGIPLFSVKPSDPFLLVEHVSIVQMPSGEILPDQSVLIHNGRFARIFPSSTYPDLPLEMIVIDGTGKYLVPGITEMHAHIPVPEAEDESLVEETLFLYLSNGVTTIRGMLGNPYHLELRERVENDEILSPRIFTSSPSLNGNTVPNGQVAVEKVQAYADEGYDFLKIHPGIRRTVFDSLVAAAHVVGISFAGHVPDDVGIRHAIAAGYASIDHIDGYMQGLVPFEERQDPSQAGFFGLNVAGVASTDSISILATATLDQGIAIVPTQSLFTRWLAPEDPRIMIQEPEMAYMPAKTRYAWVQSKSSLISGNDYTADKYATFMRLRIQLLKGLYDAGVTLLLGSDAPQVMNVPGFSLQHEMQAWQDAGIPPVDILRSATVLPAQFFESAKEFGRINEGMAADAMLLSANPLEDIRNMAQIEGVLVRGTWLDKAQITDRLQEIATIHTED